MLAEVEGPLQPPRGATAGGPLGLQVLVLAHQEDHRAILRAGHVQLAQGARITGTQRALRLRFPARTGGAAIRTGERRHVNYSTS